MGSLSDEVESGRGVPRGQHVTVWLVLLPHHSKLLNYIDRHLPRLLRIEIEAEDILVEVYHQAILNIQQFQPEGHGALYRWLVTIARNALNGAIRRHRRVRRSGGGRAAIPQALWRGGAMQALWAPQPAPPEVAAHHELLAVLEQCWERLEQDHRTALQLHCIEELDLDDVAAKMNRSRNAVRQLCWRGMMKLRSHFPEVRSC